MAPSVILTLAAFAAGPALHLGVFIRGEWHLKVPSIIWIHCVAYYAVWTLISHDGVSRSTLKAFQDASVLFGAYVMSLFTSIVIYRVYFHSLRHFPGPKLASFTKFWHIWQQRHGKNHTVLNSLKGQYGDFVRTGPNEITIFRPGAIATFESTKARTLRTDWYDVLHPRVSTIFTRDESEHASLRKTWSSALSTKSIQIYLPRIQKQVEKLVSLVEGHEGKPVLLNDVMAWFAFDSMGEFLFNEGFGMMDSSSWHEAIVQQKEALQFLAPLNDTIWLVHMALSMFPFVKQVKDWRAMVRFCEQSAEKRMKTEAKEMDIASWFIKEYHNLEQTRSETDRKQILSGSIVTAVVAGSDTTRPTLIGIFYFLCKYPEHARKIYEEIKDVPLDSTRMETLAGKSHLNAVIDESMRLLPAAMTGANRLTNEEGLWIDEQYIPPGVRVAAPKYCILRLEEAFERATEFIPERWTTSPELVKDARAFAPFGVGPRQCVGKTLALVEIRMVVAAFVQQYQFDFAEHQDVDGVVDQIRDYVTQQPGPCRVVFTKRDIKGAA